MINELLYRRTGFFAAEWSGVYTVRVVEKLTVWTLNNATIPFAVGIGIVALFSVISGSVKRTVADSPSCTIDMLDHFHFPHRPVNVFNHTLCWNWIVATQRFTHAHLVHVTTVLLISQLKYCGDR